MTKKGIALVSVLVAMVAVLMMALGMSYLAEANLSTGRNLAQQAVARQRAEAGIDHALAYLRVNPNFAETRSVSGDGYTGTITPLVPGEKFRIQSTGTFQQAKHVAVAEVRIEVIPKRQNPLFANGWISGGLITVNGGVDLHASRLHADKGYANLSGQIQVCDENGQNCKNLNQVSPPPITGGAGVGNTQCNASGTNRVVCQDNQPRYQVCPVYQEPSDQTLMCRDAITGEFKRWDQAYRITTPNVNNLSEQALGVRVTSVIPDARQRNLCQVEFTSLDPGQPTELTRFLIARNVTPVGNDTNALLRQVLPLLSGLRVCVQGNVTLPGGTTLNGVTFYVGGNFQINGSANLQDVKVAAQGGLNLGDVQATNSKFFTNGNINLNNDALFQGNSTIASIQAINFNGRANLLNNRALAIISQGDITFHGRADTHAFMWAGGRITFNGTGTFIGGAVSIGGTIRNGGGQFSIRNSNAENSDLPRIETDGGPAPRVTFRR